MKRWILYPALLLAALLMKWSPFDGTDVARLAPVELICLSAEEGNVELRTDSDALGRGSGVAEALLDLERTTPGTVFLETADFLVVDRDSAWALEKMLPYLRPACRVCFSVGKIRPEEVAVFLNAHEPGVTVLDCRNGADRLPLLKCEEDRLTLEP